MTVLSYLDPFDETRADRASPGDDAVSLDLGAAHLSIREGVLMVLGPDGDPIPPHVVIDSAAEQPGVGIAYGAESRVAADRVVAVLEAQLRGPLAPGASEADAAAWIEGMLGLGEALENEPDPWPADDPEDESGVAIDDRLGRAGDGHPRAGGPAFDAPIEPWSPEPLVLEVPERSEVEPFDPFTFEPADAESEDPETSDLDVSDLEVGNFDLMGFEPEPPAPPFDPSSVEDQAAGGDDCGSGPAESGVLPPIETRAAVEHGPIGPGGAGGPEDAGPEDAGPEVEDALGRAHAGDGPGNDDPHAGSPLGDRPVAAEGGLPAAEDASEPAPAVSDREGGPVPAAVAPPDEADGGFGLPAFLVLKPDGVLGLGCLAEAAGRLGGSILYARIEGVPDGAILTAGRDEGGGNWGLTEADLRRVSLVASGRLADFRLGLLLSSDERGDLRDALEVRVAQSEPPEAGAGANPGMASEVRLIFKPPLSPQNDLRRFALVQVAGVPRSASLSAGAPDETGSWLIAPRDLADLTIRLPAGQQEPVVLKAVAMTVDERDGTIRTIEQDLSVVPAEGQEAGPAAAHRTGRGRGRPIDLGPALERIGGEAGLTAVAINGLTGGARLSAGTFDDETGAWVLRPGDLADLALESCDEPLLPMHLRITAIRVDPATQALTARATSMTIERPARPVDLPAREARPGGVGFFRPIARRRQVTATP